MFKSACVAVLISTCCVAQNPSMFRGGATHSGVYDASGAPQLSQVKWKFKTKGEVYSSPVAADGTIYFGSTDHRLYALDLESGAKKWEFKTGSRVVSSPAIDAGVLYFGSYDGAFYAVDAATGQQKWKFQTGGERRFAAKHLHGTLPLAETMPDPFDFYLSSPVVNSGVVYFGSGDGNIYALNAADGSLKWKFATGDVVHASPALADGTIFIGSWDSFFYALDAATGKEKWRFKTGEDHEIYNQVGIQSSAAVVDGVVYFGCRDSNFYAVDENTGKQKWAFNNKGSWVIASPALRDGKVYFATSDTGLLYGVVASTGKQVFSVDGKHWPMFSSPAIAGNTLYIGSHDGTLRAVDLASGKVTGQFATDGAKQEASRLTKPDGTPNYDVAFFDDFYDGMVAGVQTMLKTGAVLSSPIVVKDAVYFGSSDGTMYAVK